MRSRSRDTRSFYMPYRERWINENGPSPTYTSTNFGPAIAVEGNSQTTIDVITPHYAERRKKGEVILNYFGSQKEFDQCNIDGPEVILDYAPVGGYRNRYLSHGAMVLNLPVHPGSSWGTANANPFTAEEQNTIAELAATKAWAKVFDKDVELQLSLIELKRTISLLLNPIQNAREFLRKIQRVKRRVDWAQDITIAQYMAREWLTYRYGWSQLYRDIRGILKALERDQRSGLQKSSGKYSETRTWSEGWASSFNGGGYLVDVKKTTTQTFTARAGIFYEADLATREYLGLTWYDTLATVWDVIPYSFVFDWVTNTQNYLGALLRAAAVPVKGSYVTTVLDQVEIWEPVGQNMLGTDYVNYGTFSKDCTGARMVQTVVKERKTPAPAPAWHTNLKIDSLIDIRVLDGLALLAKFLRYK